MEVVIVGFGLATNAVANVAQLNLSRNEQQLSTDVTRLSSGLRINSAADDPSGLAISQSLRSHVAAYDGSTANVQTANNALTVADGALATVETLLQRMRSLAVEASSDVLSNADRADLQTEVSQLLLEVNRIDQNTTFNGLALFNPPGPSEVVNAPVSYETNTIASAGPVSSIALSVPGGPTPGTIVIAALSVNNGDAITAPAGWTREATESVAGAPTLATYEHVVAAGDPDVSTWTFGSSTAVSAQIIALTGLEPGVEDDLLQHAVVPVRGPILITTVAFDILRRVHFTAGRVIAFAATDTTPPAYAIGAPGEENETGSTFGDTSANPIAGAIETYDYVPSPRAAGPGTIAFTGGPLAGGFEAVQLFLPAQQLTIGGGALDVHDGAAEGDIVGITVPGVSTSELGISGIDLTATSSTSDIAGAQSAETLLDAALATLNAARATVGAQIVSLNEDAGNDQTAALNEQAAASSIADANIGATDTEYTRANVLVQVGTSVLAQANADPQTILQLFRG